MSEEIPCERIQMLTWDQKVKPKIIDLQRLEASEIRDTETAVLWFDWKELLCYIILLLRYLCQRVKQTSQNENECPYEN